MQKFRDLSSRSNCQSARDKGIFLGKEIIMKKIILLVAVVTNTCFAAYDCNLEVFTQKKGKKEITFNKAFTLYVNSLDQTSTRIEDKEQGFNLSSKEFTESQTLSITFNNADQLAGTIQLPYLKELREINYYGSFRTGEILKSNISFIGLKCTKKVI